MANDLVLSDLTLDFNDFLSQFENYLVAQPVWKGNLTTQTSQTILELISAVGAFMEGRLVRASEDAYSETSQSDDAIRAITQMQGLRMSRKLPSAITSTLVSPVNVTLDPLTQFIAGGQYYFNRDQLTLVAGVPLTGVLLYQGQVVTYQMNGLGTNRQTYVSAEDSFSTSDLDVRVKLNGTILPKSFGGLWNYRSLPAYDDLTTADGRLLVVFGNNQFGTVPQVNDIVLISYPITNGSAGDNAQISGKPIAVDGFASINGTVTTNPTGGADEQPVLAYKNLSSGAFGTYLSAVTKSQYQALVGVYPGIIDAFTQAQRDINPGALEWMNVIRVSGITNSPWTDAQKNTFIQYMQSVSMYSTRFVWQDPIPVFRDVSLTVYCFNSAVLSQVQAACELALQNLFAPRPGLLMTNFYESDLIEACRIAGAGAVSYVIVDTPTDPMIVTAPPSPTLSFQLISGAGTLTKYFYSYGISTVNAAGEEGPPQSWVFPQVTAATAPAGIKFTWKGLPEAAHYKIYGRKAGAIGLLATIDATAPLTFTDDGSITPGVAPLNSISDLPIRYNSLQNLTVNVQYAERQQRLDSTPTRGTV